VSGAPLKSGTSCILAVFGSNPGKHPRRLRFDTSILRVFSDELFGLIGAGLVVGILAFRILRPVERKAVRNQPFPDVRSRLPEKADGHRAPILIATGGRAGDRASDSGEQGGQCTRGQPAALVVLAYHRPGKADRIPARRFPKADALAVDLDRVAVDHGRFADDVGATSLPDRAN
jgi:hypothetical protein